MKVEEKRFEPGHPLISRTPGVVGGSPAIDGTRIRIADVVGQTRLAEEEGIEGVQYVLRAYPHLTREQVEAALRFYEEHREEIDEYMEREQALLESWTPFRAST
jgi:uncharacterized protein (DUF433 family)